jgi:serine/threonine-protein kinase
MDDDHIPSTLTEGTLLGGRYRIVRLLAEGGLGVVYEAENVRTTRRVALKVMLADDEDATLAERFRREAVAATKISHPHIVDVLDLGEDEALGVLYLVQELLDGCDLRTHLHAVKRMEPAAALDTLVPVLAALVAAHARGILHRDLKPENIFLAREPNGEVTPKLIDFGLAFMQSDASAPRMTHTGMVMGTAHYMSPEQARGDRAIDGRADVWAAAVVLYEMLAGAPPLDAPTYNLLVHRILSETPARIETAAPDVPRALGDVIARALTPDRDARTPDMRAFLDALLDCPYLPGGRVDTGLRERHRKLLGAPTSAPAAGASSGAPRAGSIEYARTLTPEENAAHGVTHARSRRRAALSVGVGLALGVSIPALVLGSRGAVTTREASVVRLPVARLSREESRALPARPEAPATPHAPADAGSVTAPLATEHEIATRHAPRHDRGRVVAPERRRSAPAPTEAPARVTSRSDLLVPIDEASR